MNVKTDLMSSLVRVTLWIGHDLGCGAAPFFGLWHSIPHIRGVHKACKGNAVVQSTSTSLRFCRSAPLIGQGWCNFGGIRRQISCCWLRPTSIRVYARRGMIMRYRRCVSQEVAMDNCRQANSCARQNPVDPQAQEGPFNVLSLL